MGVQIKSNKNVGASAKLPLALPVKDGLVCAYLTYGTLEQLQMNYKNALNDASVIGSPVVSVASALFTSGSSYIETPFLESNEFTVFAVAKPGEIESGKQAMIVGNFSSGISGASLYFTSDKVNLSASYKSGLKAATRARNENNALYVARCSNDILEITDKTVGATGKATISGETRQVAGRKNRIGSGYTASAMVGNANISIVIIYNKVLSDIETEEVCTAIRRLTSSIGLTV